MRMLQLNIIVIDFLKVWDKPTILRVLTRDLELDFVTVEGWVVEVSIGYCPYHLVHIKSMKS